jgi:uncharacterized protein
MIHKSYSIQRLIPLPTSPNRSFFLWGPRKIGKTSALRDCYPNSHRIDLLKNEEFVRYSRTPELLREVVTQSNELSRQLIVIDEIQKVPSLLDEVHWLIEEKKLVFGLSGSSARKVRKGHSNLLGGRALRFELRGFVSEELGDLFNLHDLLHRGNIPDHYLSSDYQPLLRAYVADYLKEEIAAEALVRNIASFSRFLEVAAHADTEQVNFTNIARETGVSSQTVREHYQILEDTLLGSFIPAYVKRQKRRVSVAPKFYFSDVGTVNALTKRWLIEQGSEVYGKAFENFVLHELMTFRAYRSPDLEISFWKLERSAEVDVILNDLEIAIEVKSTSRVHDGHLSGLRSVMKDHDHNPRRALLVSLDPLERRTSDGIEMMPIAVFLKRLWAGDIV